MKIDSFFLEEWDAQENLMTHLKSDHFKVLRGAMNLLSEPYERMFHTVFHPDGDGEINGQKRSWEDSYEPPK